MEQLELSFKGQSRDLFRIMANIQNGYPKNVNGFEAVNYFSKKL